MLHAATLESAPAVRAVTGLRAQVRDHLGKAVDHLLSLQKPDGHWCAELEGDSILQSEYILLKWIIEQERDPRLPLVANYLRAQQREDGSWGQYPGSGPDISACVKGYFALKLMGDSAEAPHMVRARQRILALGGAEKCNSFTKFYFACLGQVRFSACPSIPPEIMYLPKWFYFSLPHVSAWTRTMILPLSIVVTKQPLRKLTPSQGIDELYLDHKVRHKLLPTNGAGTFWSKAFLVVDKFLKIVDKIGTPLRERAMRRMCDWMVEHCQGSDGLGAIFPPMVYILVALRVMGWADDHPFIKKAHKDLDDLMIIDEEKRQIRIQPCFSPIWDTGIAAYALTEAGMDHRDAPMDRCARFLLGKECRQPVDWVDNVRKKVEPSGWFFEYNNPWYPDVDDTVMVAMALRRMAEGDKRKETGDGRPDMASSILAASARGVAWALAMQNDDGGWAAFDRTKDRDLMEAVPFADHNAIQDPSCPDITGRTLECLGHHGYRVGHRAVDRAVAFIRSRQEREGCWFGRWGVNYIYGTWQVVGGLKNVGADMHAPWLKQAARWLKSIQQLDGSFGETANTYEDRGLMGTGPATASQTAWAAMSLLALGGPEDESIHRALRWLCDTQNHAGTWDEPWFTGTGFPKVFYLRYHLYRLYFPIMAMGRWLRS
jgi:squalene-hopene/tetraprenyl-beta-curcumene cyclase